MGTREFNILDKIIAYWRLGKINKYFFPNDIVLDFGCGHQAYLLKYLKDKVESGIGLDYDVANKIIKSGFETQKFRFENTIPLPDNSFTKVALLAILEHLELSLVSPLFHELHRLLQENGQIILTTPTPQSKPVMEFLANKIHLISSLEIMDHKKYYRRKDLAKLAGQTGFVVKEYHTFQFGLNSLCLFEKIN